MATFRDPKALIAHLEKAAAEQLKETIVTSQAWLGSSKNSPRDSGRLRSSWFASESVPSIQVAPEIGARTRRRQSKRRAKTQELGRDAGRPQTDAKGLEVVMGRDYYLTNNLPYAAAVALGVNLPPGWGGVHRVVSAPQDWFITFRNQETPRIMQAAGRVIKRRFDL